MAFSDGLLQVQYIATRFISYIIHIQLLKLLDCLLDWIEIKILKYISVFFCYLLLLKLVV